jgi:hypothetical protein
MAHLSAACTLISSVVSDYIPLIPFRYTVNVLLHVFSVSHWLTPIETIIPICENVPSAHLRSISTSCSRKLMIQYYTIDLAIRSIQ